MRVAWVDTDAGGRIHHTAAFRWAELAEVELFRGIGHVQGWPGRFPRREVHAEFFVPLEFDDELQVDLDVERIGRTSITFAWEIAQAGSTCVAGGHTTVHIDGDGRPQALPDVLRTELAGA